MFVQKTDLTETPSEIKIETVGCRGGEWRQDRSNNKRQNLEAVLKKSEKRFLYEHGAPKSNPSMKGWINNKLGDQQVSVRKPINFYPGWLGREKRSLLDKYNAVFKEFCSLFTRTVKPQENIWTL